MAKIWVQTCRPIACMQVGLCAMGDLCAKKGPAFSPDSIDTLTSLIQPNLAEIWACVVCMQAHSMHACKLVYLGKIVCSERSIMFS